jgi:hypothetical protein
VETECVGKFPETRADLDQAEPQGIELNVGGVADGLDQPTPQRI